MPTTSRGFVPRDSWIVNRAFFQPGRLRTFAGVVLHLEAMAASGSVQEVCERLEAADVMFRTDRAVMPTMMKGATVSAGELAQLRRIHNVVRLGHVERLEPDQIVLEQGSISTSPDHLHVHCASSGLSDNPPRTIWTDTTITLQLVTRLSLTFSGALQGFVESTGRTTEAKNRLCPPTGSTDTPFDYLRSMLAGISTELRWKEAPDLQRWRDGSRLDMMAGWNGHANRAVVRELQTRFVTALPLALDKLKVFAAQATSQERARMFALAVSTDP